MHKSLIILELQKVSRTTLHFNFNITFSPSIFQLWASFHRIILHFMPGIHHNLRFFCCHRRVTELVFVCFFIYLRIRAVKIAFTIQTAFRESVSDLLRTLSWRMLWRMRRTLATLQPSCPIFRSPDKKIPECLPQRRTCLLRRLYETLTKSRLYFRTNILTNLNCNVH